MKPYRLELTVPGLPPMNTATTRRHWSHGAKVAARWRQIIAALVGRKKPAVPLPFAIVTLTRCSSVEPDYDNLVMSCKPVIDALKHAGVVLDDKSKHLVRHYGWEYSPRGKGQLRIVIEQD